MFGKVQYTKIPYQLGFCRYNPFKIQDYICGWYIRPPNPDGGYTYLP